MKTKVFRFQDGKRNESYIEEIKQIMRKNNNVDTVADFDEKGNYVIAGGDFNQTFPGVDTEKFPIVNTENFVPSQMSNDYLPKGFKFVTDLERPSSRLLNEVYSGSYDNTQLYIIDGYIVSPNIDVRSVETIENNFSYSDHQPVKLKIKLK